MINYENSLANIGINGLEVNPANLQLANTKSAVLLTQKTAVLTKLQVELTTVPSVPDEPNYHLQSDTMENYMDYDFIPATSSTPSSIKTSFERKVFYQSQWQKMKGLALSSTPPYLTTL